ncbi:MAG: hypothetical protein HKN07_00010 [Acidimicrobiia bacterium]|nr:hypothetical protein [Acidimicrobiia bacterium]
MTQRIPNLFLVGAMRSGTTSLHEALASHRSIFMSDVKEPAHFTDPAELATDSRFASAAGFAGDRAKYLELFASAGDAQYAGESSTHYTKAPRINGVAERVFEASPGARILYLVRDPIERTLSHYRFAVRMKYERRTIREAVRDPFYSAVSDYAMQLEPYLDRFGRDQIWIGTLEEMSADAESTLGDLYTWLGVDPDGGDLAYRQRNAVSSDLVRARGPELLHRAGRSDGYQRLARAVLPAGVRRTVRRVLNRSVEAEEVRDDSVIEYLRTVQAPFVERFEAMTGREFGAWTTTRPVT